MGETPVVVAVDGPAGSGKSTIARKLADALGWAYLDSGALYRVFTLAALEAGVDPDDPDGLLTLGDLDVHFSPDGAVRLASEDVTQRIREGAVTRAAPRVAAHPDVRDRVTAFQRAFAARAGRLIAEGRDTGTVVFPDAALKVYLDADAGERARRRLLQQGGDPEAGGGAELDRVRAAIEERDRRDRTRVVAPLARAADAWVLDTTKMTLGEVLDTVLARVRSGVPVASDAESEA